MELTTFMSAVSTFSLSKKVSLTAPKGTVKTVDSTTNFVGNIDWKNFLALLKSVGYRKLFIKYFNNAKNTIGIFADNDLICFTAAKAKDANGKLKDNKELIFTLFKEDENEVLKNGHDVSKDNVSFCLSAKSSTPTEVEMDL